MLAALGGMAGGGGMSASSSASSDQQVANDISSGTITVGGLNLNPKKSGMDSDMILQGGVAVGIGLAALWAFKQIKK